MVVAGTVVGGEVVVGSVVVAVRRFFLVGVVVAVGAVVEVVAGRVVVVAGAVVVELEDALVDVEAGVDSEVEVPVEEVGPDSGEVVPLPTIPRVKGADLVWNASTPESPATVATATIGARFIVLLLSSS